MSHCYLRATGEDWPYNVYTMIHGNTPASVADTVAAIVAAAGDCPRVELPTSTEYKKSRVRLFSPEFARWESAVAG